MVSIIQDLSLAAYNLIKTFFEDKTSSVSLTGSWKKGSNTNASKMKDLTNFQTYPLRNVFDFELI